MKRLLPLLLIAFVSGCIEVMDMDHFWADALPDPMLVGQWRSENGDVYEFLPSGRDLLLREVTQTNAISKTTFMLYFQSEQASARSITFNGQSFLLIKRPNGSGALCRYVIASNDLTCFRLRDSVIEQGIRSNAIQGKIPERIPYNSEDASVPDPLTAFQACEITVLTSDAMNFFTSENNANYWDTLRSFSRAGGTIVN